MLISQKVFQFMSLLFLVTQQSCHTQSSRFLHSSLNTTIGCVTYPTKLLYQMFLVNLSQCRNTCFFKLLIYLLLVIHLYSYLLILHKDSCKVINRLLFLYCEFLSHSTLSLKVQFLPLIYSFRLNFALLFQKVSLHDTCPNDSFFTFFRLTNSSRVI